MQETSPPTATRSVVATAGPAQLLAQALDLAPVRLVTRAPEVLAAAAAGTALAACVAEELQEDAAVELARQLRAARLGSGLPLIIVTQRYSDAAEEEALAAGADEYVDAAAIGPRLVRRVRARLEQAWRREDLNPLTGLPGRRRLERELSERLARAEQLAVVGLDVRHFKSFNDRYGYERGDRLLQVLRDAVVEALGAAGEAEDVAIHLGGDDFLLLTQPERAEGLVAQMRETFDRRAAELYDESDRQAGGFVSRSRAGEQRQVPLVWLVAVAVVSGAAALGSPAQFARALAELKEFAQAGENRELVWGQAPGP